MTKEEIIKLFNEFCTEFNFEKKENIWRKQSEEFQQFWHEKILDDSYPELLEADMDYVIRFFDSNARGAREFRENGGEHAAKTGIYQGMWYRTLKDLKNKQDIREILNNIFEAKDDGLKINLVNKLEKVNQKNKNGLTGRSAIILNAILFTHSPDKYLTMLSIVNHRLPLIDFFELGDSKQYKTYGEQVIKTNNDIVLGFKEKYGIDTTPYILSNFIYKLEKIYHWKEKIDDFNQETTDDAEEGEASVCQSFFVDKTGFVLEKHLEDFLVANWETTELGELYGLIEESGDMVSQQYPTKEIGNIDLLVKDKKTGNYVVIELKKGLTSDQTVGQLTRYMGWVKKNKSSGGKVEGIIIAGGQDDRLKYALEAVPNAKLFIYRINFVLEEPEK